MDAALVNAIYGNDVHKVGEMLRAIHGTDVSEWWCLFASEAWSDAMVDAVVTSGIDVNARDGSGRTLLHHALETDNDALVEGLVARPDVDLNILLNGETYEQHAVTRTNAGIDARNAYDASLGCIQYYGDFYDPEPTDHVTTTPCADLVRSARARRA